MKWNLNSSARAVVESVSVWLLVQNERCAGEQLIVWHGKSVQLLSGMKTVKRWSRKKRTSYTQGQCEGIFGAPGKSLALHTHKLASKNEYCALV
jgi:hypothetical protein